ncbi:MAG: helix-turn-helix transcriptional regulator [Campylobacterales bacterium]
MGKNQNYDKILFRLTTILQRLYEGESLSMSELADEFGVSRKTIQRDFNERLIRFPIQKEGRVWKMSEGYAIEKSRTLEEIVVLDVLSEIAEGVSREFSQKTKALFSKIKNSDENPIFSKIQIEDISQKSELFQKLQLAISEKKQIEVVYKSKKRVINPYKIVSFEGFWYLYAEELNDKKLKTFYLKELEALSLLESSFEVKSEWIDRLKYAINIWFEPNSELFSVSLLAKKDIAKYFYRRPLSSEQIVYENRDGSIEIELKATSFNEVLHEVKKWMPNLLILSPKNLQEESLKLADSFIDSTTRLA